MSDHDKPDDNLDADVGPLGRAFYEDLHEQEMELAALRERQMQSPEYEEPPETNAPRLRLVVDNDKEEEND